MRVMFIIAAALTCGCQTTAPGHYGYDIADHYPLDGSVLVWEYNNEESSDHLTVEKIGSESLDEREVITLTHTLTNEEGEQTWVADVRWASDPVVGVLLYGYAQGETVVDLEPPVILANRHGVPGDVATTYSNGQGWISTFERIEGCATFWVPQWVDESCLVLTLDDGDDDPATNGIVTGTYHLVPRYGAAWLELDAYGVQWRLSDHSWVE